MKCLNMKLLHADSDNWSIIDSIVWLNLLTGNLGELNLGVASFIAYALESLK